MVGKSEAKEMVIKHHDRLAEVDFNYLKRFFDSFRWR